MRFLISAPSRSQSRCTACCRSRVDPAPRPGSPAIAKETVTQYGGALSVSALQRSTDELLLTSPGLTPDQSSWFAVQTRPRYEKKVTAELHEKGIKTFLPLCSAMHQWSDRRRLVHVPIFSGYVFVRIATTLTARISVLRTNGVLNFVGVRNMGVPDP